MSARAPHALWAKAQAKHPNDETKRRELYFRLMVEAGHLILKPDETPDDVLAELAAKRRRVEAESRNVAMP